MLHITSGDAAVHRLREANLPGEFLPWRDVLHEGPAPAGLSLEQLSQIRARFIAQSGWGSYEEVSRDFEERNRTLGRFRDHEEAVLWFDPDLYDQLQLIQLLDWFSWQPAGPTRLSLAQLTPHPPAGAFEQREPVTDAEHLLGRRAWECFCSAEPTSIESLLAGDTTALPFLDGALRRHLEQFPAARNGLSRTERQILEAVSSGVARPAEVFRASQASEERVFMGDTVFWSCLGNLAKGKKPLLQLRPLDNLPIEEFLNQTAGLTDTGLEVLDNREDTVRLNGIDRWLGGVHLIGHQGIWRWDDVSRKMVRA